jgi:hypothetical protein
MAIDLRRNLNKERYLKKATMYDQIITLEIQARKDDEQQTRDIVKKWAGRICDRKNPWNHEYLKRHGVLP